MVSDTNIKKSRFSRKDRHMRDRRLRNRRLGARRPAMFSRLARFIFLSNIVGLLILVCGAMTLQRFSQGLIEAKIENLSSQAALITTIMGDTATGIGLAAELDVQNARDVLSRVNLPDRWRVRLHDKSGTLIADSTQYETDIAITELAPIVSEIPEPTWQEVWQARIEAGVEKSLHNLPWRVHRRERLRQNLTVDIRKALAGESVAGERYNKQDELIVSLSLPVKRVQQVLGVVTLESSDVDNIVNGERRALAPIIGLAFLAAILSSLALTLFIVLPMRRLARAAERVTRSAKERDAIPDLSRRRDEIGDLSIVMREMTNGLYDRINDIAKFAADVAHEIKNPLTSLRSASDSLRVAKTAEQRKQLVDIIQNDVARMDRLITDISNASKVDANLARETAQTLDVHEILSGLTDFYAQTYPGDARVIYVRQSASLTYDNEHDLETPNPADGQDIALNIRAFETPFAQVLRNLIDNALTFSPPKGEVLLRAFVQADPARGDRVIIVVEDDGPGIPPENLETVFERFYTERPQGARFGSHSGLGLAICHQIVKAHKGEIHAENRVNPGSETIKGARFVINLPRQSQNSGGYGQKRSAGKRLKR